MTQHDTLQRFVFENIPVRGEIVHLGRSFEIIKSNHPYPEPVAQLLGQSLAAATLLTNILKFDGWLILEIHGEGPLKLLVAQADAKRHIRGLAHWEGAADVGFDTFAKLVPKGRIVITIQTHESNERYQGIVELKGDSLASALEHYFLQSEQLPTYLFFASDDKHAAGMILQVMPGHFDPSQESTWEHLMHLSRTLKAEELLELDNEELLRRLFREEDIRLFDLDPISFNCNCSRERMEHAILTMSYEEAMELVRKEKNIVVTCEFCNRKHSFDVVDVESIFSHKNVKGNQQIN